jgi:hypothetical protein
VQPGQDLHAEVVQAEVGKVDFRVEELCFDKGQDNVTGFESLCSEFFLNEIMLIFEVLEVWCICG